MSYLVADGKEPAGVAWSELPTLLEEERHASRLALVAKRSSPVRMHGPSVVAGFAADDNPIDVLEVVGSVVLPGLAVTALFLVPFFDRGRVRRVTERTAAIGVVALAALGWTGLTVAAIRTTPPATEVAAFDGPQDWQELSPEALARLAHYLIDTVLDEPAASSQSRRPLAVPAR